MNTVQEANDTASNYCSKHALAGKGMLQLGRELFSVQKNTLTSLVTFTRARRVVTAAAVTQGVRRPGHGEAPAVPSGRDSPGPKVVSSLPACLRGAYCRMPARRSYGQADSEA